MPLVWLNIDGAIGRGVTGGWRRVWRWRPDPGQSYIPCRGVPLYARRPRRLQIIRVGPTRILPGLWHPIIVQKYRRQKTVALNFVTLDSPENLLVRGPYPSTL